MVPSFWAIKTYWRMRPDLFRLQGPLGHGFGPRLAEKKTRRQATAFGCVWLRAGGLGHGKVLEPCRVLFFALPLAL